MRKTRYDTELTRGSTFRRVFLLKKADGTPLDLTGYDVRSYMRQTHTSPDFISLNAQVENAAEGKISLSLPASVTDLITYQKGVYDVELLYPNGDVQQLVYGKINVDQEVTHDR